MTVPGNLSSPLLATATGAAAAAEYAIPKSLRFNDGDSAYLTKTFSSAGNRRTFTFSCWVKRGSSGIYPVLFSGYGGDTNNFHHLRFDNSDKLETRLKVGTTKLQLITDQVFRDFSSFYHIVFAYDSTQSTSSNRAKLYVNGSQITDFSTETYPDQNQESFISNSAGHFIGQRGDSNLYFDGLMADIQFVDGQALAPTDFGETRSSDGVWVPKEYTGEFGPLLDQSQDWTSLLTTSAGTITNPSYSFDGNIANTSQLKNTSAGSYIQFGVTLTNVTKLEVYQRSNSDISGTGIQTYNNAPSVQWVELTLTSSTVSNIRFEKNTNDPGIYGIRVNDKLLVDSSVSIGNNSFHLNFSDSSTNEALGFDSAPTTPDPDPKKGFDVITYTGNGGTQNIGGLNFEPGLVWIKTRSHAQNHGLFDSVRGAGRSLRSSTTGEERGPNTGSDGDLTSFNPDGFSLGSCAVSGAAAVNVSSQTQVAWAWRAGGPAVANSDGTITSQVSANTDYGFSIVTYTGGTSDATIGHGLGQTPKFYIVKARESTAYTDFWSVYHTSLGESAYIKLNEDSAATTGSTIWNSTAPTTALFSVDATSIANENNTDYVAYVWSEVSGYSKFTSFTGNGSTTGPTITCGFKPRWILLKNTSSNSTRWIIWDTERDDNTLDKGLSPNLNSAEITGFNATILDDGFQITDAETTLNQNGATIIVAAFADRPGNNWDVNNIVTNEGLTTSKTQFDVLTYTGNGGNQKLGGPVYSNSLVASNGSFESVAPASGAFNGETGTANGDYAQASSGSNPNSLTFTPEGGIAYSTGVEVYTISSSTTVSVNGGSAQSVSASQWVSVASGSGTLTSLVVTRASTSGASLSGIRIDGTVLLDGTGPGLKFQPDLVWIKSRSQTSFHVLCDSVRGAGVILSSNRTTGDTNNSDSQNAFKSFNSDGFTVGQGAAWSVNDSNETHVAWCWKAGGTAVSNTDGTITSSVSANAAYGFSVGTYTGTYSSQPSSLDTVGHGLNGKVPGMIISKSTNGTSNWHVWHKGLDNDEYIRLNSTNGKATLSTGAGGSIATAPTGTVFPTYYIGGSNNGSSDNLVFYCFADVPGYQRFGSYTGNGSSSGPVIVTGFKPRFLLAKKTSADGRQWLMLDSQRDPSNPLGNRLYAENTAADDPADVVNFVDNGFEIISATSDLNDSGATYIYWAIGDDEIGSDEDCLVDVPNAVTADADATDTTGGYQRGNYATLNPLDVLKESGSTTSTLSNGNLDVAFSSGTNAGNQHHSTIGVSSGKYYVEWTDNSSSPSSNSQAFIAGVQDTATQGNFLSQAGGYGISTGSVRQLWLNGSNTNTWWSGTPAQGDVYAIALDCDNSTITFYRNGSSLGSAQSIPSGKTYVFAITVYQWQATPSVSVNFGQKRFKYPMPSGYAALNTTALPAATIEDGSAHFDTKLFTGNHPTGQSITGYSFSPDWLWLKDRGGTNWHYVFDTIRGTEKAIFTNANNAEGTYANTLTAFNSDGFTVGSDNATNQNGNGYAAWTWNAGANSNKTYTVKVVSDSGNKYRFDDFGTSAVTLDLAEGSTYVFDQSDSSNSGHPLRFSTTSDGTHGGGSEYTTGVTATGTPGSAGAKTTIVVGSGVATLYYYCTNHSGMGGQANTNSTAGASNFDGSIQSTVKANPEAGFSIVSWTGTRANATVGHGLNASLGWYVVKRTNTTGDWIVYHTGLTTGTGYIRLNTTGASGTAATPWNSTAPTASVFSLGADSETNGNGDDMLAYCFTPVAGYSAFGSYTGNGSSDGPFVYTGFRPAVILQKRTDSTGSWTLVDTARDVDNPAALELLPNSNAAEYDNTSLFDILSNGFKVRATFNNLNASGGSFIYIAFAENPFQANGGLAR